MESLPDRPLLVEHLRLQERAGGFVPAARPVVLPALRESGLLSLLSDRQARLLLALLTFTSPNGQIQATAVQVAKALGMPVPIAALRLRRFAGRRFHGTHLVYELRRHEGYPLFAVSHMAIHQEHRPPSDPHLPVPIGSSRRAEILAHSRAAYASPRLEVERTVMQQLGHAAEELLDTPEGAVWRRLHVLRFGREDILAMIRAYGIERISRQLDWLPERGAKDPARYLIAALEGDYAKPSRLRDRLNARSPSEPGHE